MQLLRLLNKAARTLGYSQYPNNNVGFLGVVPSRQNLLRACSSSCSSMITESVPPRCGPFLSNTVIEALGSKEFQDPGFFSMEPVEEMRFGGYMEIKNPENNPKLINIANIAVELFNKYQFSGAYVELLRVLEASVCYVSGSVYYIILEGIDQGAGVKREYGTEVSIRLDQKWRLVSFEPKKTGWTEVGAASDPCDESKQDPLF